MCGGNFNNADGGTQASASSFLLDFSRAPLAWQQEAQATPRVMPDAVLLPDGTVVIVNGAAYGIAGGSPGNSNAFNNGNYGPRCAELYNPAQPVGQRWSGLLADSTFDRLYHSEAYLTTNGDVSPI